MRAELYISILIGSIIVSGPVGCATAEFDRYFEAHRYDAAARVFEADPSLHEQERALFRAGLAHALPLSPVYSPELARSLLERLVVLHPRSSYRDAAERIIALIGEVERVDQIADRRQTEADRLEAETARLRAQVAWIETRFEVQEGVIDALRQVIERLESEARDKELRIRALQDELDRLKEIDLKPARSGEPETPPDSVS